MWGFGQSLGAMVSARSTSKKPAAVLKDKSGPGKACSAVVGACCPSLGGSRTGTGYLKTVALSLSCLKADPLLDQPRGKAVPACLRDRRSRYRSPVLATGTVEALSVRFQVTVGFILKSAAALHRTRSTGAPSNHHPIQDHDGRKGARGGALRRIDACGRQSRATSRNMSGIPYMKPSENVRESMLVMPENALRVSSTYVTLLTLYSAAMRAYSSRSGHGVCRKPRMAEERRFAQSWRLPPRSFGDGILEEEYGPARVEELLEGPSAAVPLGLPKQLAVIPGAAASLGVARVAPRAYGKEAGVEIAVSRGNRKVAESQLPRQIHGVEDGFRHVHLGEARLEGFDIGLEELHHGVGPSAALIQRAPDIAQDEIAIRRLGLDQAALNRVDETDGAPSGGLGIVAAAAAAVMVVLAVARVQPRADAHHGRGFVGDGRAPLGRLRRRRLVPRPLPVFLAHLVERPQQARATEEVSFLAATASRDAGRPSWP
ncbi:hypothetical protein Trco_000450 [Trichoderma cornu-damae]|uniref:Uncharacterized protein n=1 Tax=Trichoderma cornu-damae TaxID=654480 RepID=A0A9P8QQB5_9HYPO|nr:hypothetical protein Trco_000450 [Trichoderma cornu-damae]